MLRLALPAILGIAVAGLTVHAAEKNESKDRSVEQIAAAARKSIVVITVRGRDGKREGMGTGFVVGAGLLATNFHVIGEGRPIQLETAEGKKLNVTHIHAASRGLDLAILRIDDKGIPSLPLGDSTTLKDGQAVVAIGNPQGLRHSVVAGVVSGKRDIDGRAMIQVAIPIEPGNSGGPLLDMQGRVHGIMTIKSLVTANLGFAVASDLLRPLLKKPNPVPLSAWLTIGQLDAEDWLVTGGSRWRQRAGRIQVEGVGAGFGGRSLCLSKRATPALPFEVAVAVKLDDEAGAAGLAFHSDGGDRHYGFYPSNGQMRLTRFDGPDVFTWKVLRQDSSPHYKPGEWNALKVRLEKGRIKCFVNDQQVYDVEDDGLTEGGVGLCKFRDTVAEFKHFRLGKELPASTPAPAVLTRVSKTIEQLPRGAVKPDVVDQLSAEGSTSLGLLRERARALEQQAVQLKQLAAQVHQKTVLAELAKLFKEKEETIDLIHAALLLARLDNDELDVAAYRGEVERMAQRIIAKIPKQADESAKLTALKQHLFAERGFHGSRSDYYHRSNSYLSEVIDDREGLPITLSVLYMELGRRLGLKIEGVGLPGHFVVRHVSAKGDGRLIDVYEGGTELTREDAATKVREITGQLLREDHLAPVSKKAIIVRMLHNLLRVARGERDNSAMLRYLDAIVMLAPESAEERGLRAGVRYQAGDREGSLSDVDWLLENQPEGVDLEKLRELRRMLTRPRR